MVTALASGASGWAPRCDADPGYYVGGDVGIGKADIVTSNLNTAFAAAFDGLEFDPVYRQTGSDRDDLTYGAIVGYRFSPYLALELQYLWLGEYSMAGEGTVSDGEITAVSRATASWHVKGPAASVLASWPVSSRWDLFGRAGAVWAQTDATFTVEDFIVSERAKAKETTTELLWGIGAAYHPTRQWTLRFEYQQVPDVGEQGRTGEIDVERYTFGWVYSY
jgi:opacity protein-like surface antigen